MRFTEHGSRLYIRVVGTPSSSFLSLTEGKKSFKVKKKKNRCMLCVYYIETIKLYDITQA